MSTVQKKNWDRIHQAMEHVLADTAGPAADRQWEDYGDRAAEIRGAFADALAEVIDLSLANRAGEESQVNVKTKKELTKLGALLNDAAESAGEDQA